MGSGVEGKNWLIRAVDAIAWVDRQLGRVPEPIRALPAALTRAVWTRTMGSMLRRMRGER